MDAYDVKKLLRFSGTGADSDEFYAYTNYVETLAVFFAKQNTKNYPPLKYESSLNLYDELWRVCKKQLKK
jgi:hypothetical protein